MAKKQYFGEETKSKKKAGQAGQRQAAPAEKRKYTRRAASDTGTKRKYTRRAKGTEEMITIQVPASLAYQIGVTVGQQVRA